MANPVDFSDRVTSGSNVLCSIYGTVSATYVREGSKVKITITTKVTGGSGRYYQVHVNNDDAISFAQSTGTKTKTYTYDDPAAKTYSFGVWIYLQYQSGYDGYTYTKGPLTIDVPVAGAQVYTKQGGAWKTADKTYVKVNGVWKEELTQCKAEGEWKL